jgi:hypothetical protein
VPPLQERATSAFVLRATEVCLAWCQPWCAVACSLGVGVDGRMNECFHALQSVVWGINSR